MNVLKKDNTMDIQSQYDLRQREYQSMLEHKIPEPIDFNESSADSVIQNMDELIQSHLAEREKDLQLFSTDKVEQTESNHTIHPKPVVLLNPDEKFAILEKRIAELEQKIGSIGMKVELLDSRLSP